MDDSHHEPKSELGQSDRVQSDLRMAGCRGPEGRVPYQAGCPDCPASRQGLLKEVVGETKAICGFDSFTLEPRTLLPLDWHQQFGFGLVRRGILIRERADSQGRSTAVDAAGSGCLFSLDLDARSSSSSSTYYAVNQVIVCLCPTEVVDEFVAGASPSASELLELFSGALSRVERLAQARGRQKATERVASLLCTLADTLSPPRRREEFPIDLQQRDLARLAGIRHETFCRALAKLEEDNLVARRPDGLRILNRDALEAL